ncbi:MAG: hypothetical protein K5905_26760 [Roseibium sp.]|uniref:hypothetical protein n=1 Tax=Roseibium sp. TaxID=1936156 RepID=UPI002605C752|nr:hypothetical protein [Roseibium sp.]MCV0429070.1 hypothetical protein [Roseibium sp.]
MRRPLIFISLAVTIVIAKLLMDLAGFGNGTKSGDTKGTGYVPAKHIEFDPDLCPTDAEGKIYVRLLTGYAFALFLDRLWIYDTDRREPVTPPTNPHAPEGCPGNPLHIEKILGLSSFLGTATTEQKLGKLGIRGTGRVMVRTPIITGDDYPWDNMFQNFFNICRKYKHSRIIAGDLRACWAPQRKHSEKVWPVSYMAIPNRYTTPLGKPFFAKCLGAFGADSSRDDCSFGYSYLPGLVVSVTDYNEAYIPPYRLIQFDRLLRDTIEGARVPHLDFKIVKQEGNSTNE